MMPKKTCLALAVTLNTGLFLSAFAAQGDDPDWPCIQRRVPELSIAQIWTGPQLPLEAADWAKDPLVSGLVADLAARRLPLPQAQERIETYRDSLPEAQKWQGTALLVQGLFDKMNSERSQVIAGIARYARNQREMAMRLRQEASAVDALRARPNANDRELAQRSERLMFQTRIFHERAESLTFVCEVPTLIEQRLYALVKTLSKPFSR
jgi:hypothetical protein